MIVGVSLKMYFGLGAAHDWCRAVAALAADRPELEDGRTVLFVAPSHLAIPGAAAAFAGTPIRLAAQDVAAGEPGPYTGEVSAAELAEAGVAVVEIGHAERRRLYGETDETVAAKVAVAARHGLTALICVGARPDEDAAAVAEAQLRAAVAQAPAGPVWVAYEPLASISAARPAPAGEITPVTRHLRQVLAEVAPGGAVLYGGSAGPGLLGELGDGVDGLFLGRFAHDPANLAKVLDEALEGRA
ncbi:triose-phosphate isomerase [Dactylosporangium sucinum]|uniref:Triosephosphate isomerase n=1 Tax=Dactylosporangium sucinum TaxID=1424081 RepID=A0A917WXL3_9ACTN|nr:triose-phosphate isomerase family protein [Dactylosporangium sucinum]GGM37341.1 triosephosphate isomerase [Dactylosporangium sucinum]